MKIKVCFISFLIASITIHIASATSAYNGEVRKATAVNKTETVLVVVDKEDVEEIEKCNRCIKKISGSMECESPYGLEAPFQCQGSIIYE